MPKKWSIAEAYRAYDAAPVNPRWGWSGVAADGTVVISLWRDRIALVDGEPRVDYFGAGELLNGSGGGAGNRARIGHLRQALAEHDGRVRAVVMVADNPNAKSRAIRECYPYGKVWLRITALDPETGEFRAVFDGQD